MIRLLVAGMSGQLGHGLAGVLADAADAADAAGLVRLTRVVARAHPAGRGPAGGGPDGGGPDGGGRVVPGDVRQPGWGLGADALADLSDVGVVVNLAAETNWAAAQQALFTANTVGAVEGLNLARRLQEAHGRRVAYIYASTVYVAGGRLGVVPETPLGPCRHRTVYEESKWLGEQALVEQWRPGDPPVLIARFAALVGDSVTGTTRRRNSLYLLAARWEELPLRMLPAMRDARVDALPRDVAARALLAAARRIAAGGTDAYDDGPAVVHVAGGQSAPTLRALLELARSQGPHRFRHMLRLVPTSAERILWLSQNPGRFYRPDEAWTNSLTGLRYVALDRVYETTRLRSLLPATDVPQVEPALLARILFGLPASPVAAELPGDPAMARFE
ncbi:SDR family oxidoreductase [Frankia sp. CiP3]|uniref:SDR family oxidoreductase n=1 Tax=Frankia sp. CiP3 TaxID=2880971 RepID=UPI001EF43F27|nr:SDR family oxidoreductase [Frankia sp. CiP3]